mmetsp:Transcript_54283/g.168389  ORF Transcript_54283/g.168389 Transcript_54283/m.168389 type:complete len:1094 (-) Transcript_54283:107-3388(-)
MDTAIASGCLSLACWFDDFQKDPGVADRKLALAQRLPSLPRASVAMLSELPSGLEGLCDEINRGFRDDMRMKESARRALSEREARLDRGRQEFERQEMMQRMQEEKRARAMRCKGAISDQANWFDRVLEERIGQATQVWEGKYKDARLVAEKADATRHGPAAVKVLLADRTFCACRDIEEEDATELFEGSVSKAIRHFRAHTEEQRVVRILSCASGRWFLNSRAAKTMFTQVTLGMLLDEMRDRLYETMHPTGSVRSDSVMRQLDVFMNLMEPPRVAAPEVSLAGVEEADMEADHLGQPLLGSVANHGRWAWIKEAATAAGAAFLLATAEEVEDVCSRILSSSKAWDSWAKLAALGCTIWAMFVPYAQAEIKDPCSTTRHYYLGSQSHNETVTLRLKDDPQCSVHNQLQSWWPRNALLMAVAVVCIAKVAIRALLKAACARCGEEWTLALVQKFVTPVYDSLVIEKLPFIYGLMQDAIVGLYLAVLTAFLIVALYVESPVPLVVGMTFGQYFLQAARLLLSEPMRETTVRRKKLAERVRLLTKRDEDLFVYENMAQLSLYNYEQRATAGMLSDLMVHDVRDSQIDVTLKDIYLAALVLPSYQQKPYRIRYVRVRPFHGWHDGRAVLVDLFAGRYAQTREGTGEDSDTSIDPTWSDLDINIYTFLVGALGHLSTAEAEMEALMAQYEAHRDLEELSGRTPASTRRQELSGRRQGVTTRDATGRVSTRWALQFGEMRARIHGDLRDDLARGMPGSDDMDAAAVDCEVKAALSVWTAECYNGFRQSLLALRGRLQKRLDGLRSLHLGPPFTAELQEMIHREGHLACELYCGREGPQDSMKGLIEASLGVKNLFEEMLRVPSRLSELGSLPELWLSHMEALHAKIKEVESTSLQHPSNNISKNSGSVARLGQQLQELGQQVQQNSRQIASQEMERARKERREAEQKRIWREVPLENTPWDSEELDCSAIRYAVRRDVQDFARLREQTRGDERFVTMMARENWQVVRHVPRESWARFGAQRVIEVVQPAVRHDAGVFNLMPERLCDDPGFVEQMVRANWRVLQYVSAALRDSAPIVRAAVGQDRTALQYASERLKKQL